MSATNLINDVPAVKSDEIIMPASTMESASSRRLLRLMRYASSTAASPKKNALRVMARYPAAHKIASAAPKPAPVDAPSRSGETMGLRNIP